MASVRINSLMVSLDGYAAGSDQSASAPMGIGGEKLSAWLWETEFGQSMIGKFGGSAGVDNEWLRRGEANIGATVMGRNMFGPQRGPWPNDDWKGWWGPNPPYRHPVFVLSHHGRPSLEMEGGTSFTFVNDGIESATQQAFAAAKGKDVRINGGASTLNQYLKAGLVDELHLVMVPVLLGNGERVFTDMDGLEDRYVVAEYIPSATVAHVRLVKKAA